MHSGDTSDTAEGWRTAADKAELLTILENVNTGIMLVDPQTRVIMDINTAAAHMIGRPRQEIIGTPCHKSMCPAEQNHCPVLDQGQTVDHSERILLTAAGGQVPIQKSVTWVRLHGRPYLLECFEDISTLKQTDAVLRKSRRALFTLMSNLPGMAYRCRNDENWTMEFVSEGVWALTGYTATELTHSTRVAYRQVIHPEDRAMVWAEVQAGVREHRPFRITYRIVTATGDVKWAWEQGAAIYSEHGEVLALEGFITDITERKRAEEELQKREALLRIAGSTARFGGWSVRLTEQKIVWSDEVAAIHEMPPGYSPSVEEGIQFYAPEWRARITQAFTACAQDGTPYDEELELITRGGRRIWVRTIGEALRDASGAIVQIQGSFQDITGQKTLERVRHDLEQRLQQTQKAESLGRMAGAIAHHYNNLLGVVLGNLELALEDLAADTRARENLTEAMRAARRAADVSNMMLTYLGQTPGQGEALDLSSLCCRHLSSMTPGFPQHVTLETVLPASGPIIFANAHQVQQILANLVANAVEAIGSAPGVVRLAVQTVSGAQIKSANRYPVDWQPTADAHYACLDVSDTGCGITPKEQEKLFDPFFSTKFTGRGLGLPVTLGLARSHGGGITVTSQPGAGSAFRVFFPLTNRTPSPHPAKSEDVESFTPGGTLLLVEDDPALRETARAMLTRMGFTVLSAADGVEATQLFRRHRKQIRCVLCDLTMPHMNGWETLATLRELQPGVTVVLASGYDQAQVMSGNHAEWPQAFLQKPYMAKELKAVLNRVLTPPA